MKQKQKMRRRSLRYIHFAIFMLFSCEIMAQQFVHPGILHSMKDLERMKKAVALKEEPVYQGYRLFIQDPASMYSYGMQGPLQMVGRNPTIGQTVYDSDANAAYQNAIMWAITGEKAYADKAIEIINGWCSELASVTGRDAVLMAGLGPFKMVNSAEIIRYTGAGWQEADIKRAEKHFKEVIYPVVKDYAPFANGNWDAAAMKTVMAIAVFCNDRGMFNDALNYYVNGAGDGRLEHYVINEQGQIQESGRDQAHTQLGIGMLAECCQIVWNQGLDLFGYADNRLLKGFEYVAKYNLGNEVPFTETLDRTGKYHHQAVSVKERGKLRAVYEQVYAHYVKRMHLSAPFLTRAAETIRPEGPGKPGADHPGYGTLFFSYPNGEEPEINDSVPVPPSGIITVSKSSSVILSWVAAVAATGYTVKRSEQSGGPYRVIAANLPAAMFADRSVKREKLYYYVVTALNAKGESRNSAEAAVYTALPRPWKQYPVGTHSDKGHTQFDGKMYIVTAAGAGAGSSSDSFHYTAIPLKRESAITLRYIPQLSSQFTSFGISIRERPSGRSAHVSLAINPGKTNDIEAPDWHARLSTRPEEGGVTGLIGPPVSLPEGVVSYGRLTGYCWLRLERKGRVVKAFVSADGSEWKDAGSTAIPFRRGFIGFWVASGMANPTVVKFDNVSVH